MNGKGYGMHGQDGGGRGHAIRSPSAWQLVRARSRPGEEICEMGRAYCANSTVLAPIIYPQNCWTRLTRIAVERIVPCSDATHLITFQLNKLARARQGDIAKVDNLGEKRHEHRVDKSKIFSGKLI